MHLGVHPLHSGVQLSAPTTFRSTLIRGQTSGPGPGPSRRNVASSRRASASGRPRVRGERVAREGLPRPRKLESLVREPERARGVDRKRRLALPLVWRRALHVGLVVLGGARLRFLGGLGGAWHMCLVLDERGMVACAL